MSAREWQPGDVAMVTLSDDREYIAEVRKDFGRPQWFGAWNGFGAEMDAPTSARPLVVIDPEDREKVERLDGLIDKALSGPDAPKWHGPADCLQAALREFANPTPPRPEEPTGLGAVVEDRDGIRWVRSLRADVEFSTPWRDCNDDHFARHYDAIAAVRVLSEGVTA